MNAIIKQRKPTIEQLITEWKSAKNDENEAKDRRLTIEQLILEQADIKSEGTTKVGSLSISTGNTRDWDQAVLTELSVQVKPEYWPFKSEFKEDRKASKVIEERFPDLWKTINTALLLKPKKPTFSARD